MWRRQSSSGVGDSMPGVTSKGLAGEEGKRGSKNDVSRNLAGNLSGSKRQKGWHVRTCAKRPLGPPPPPASRHCPEEPPPPPPLPCLSRTRAPGLISDKSVIDHEIFSSHTQRCRRALMTESAHPSTWVDVLTVSPGAPSVRALL